MGKQSSLSGISGKEDSYTARAVTSDSPDYSPVELPTSYDGFGSASPYARINRFLSSYVERAREATQNLFYRYDLLQRTDDRIPQSLYGRGQMTFQESQPILWA